MALCRPCPTPAMCRMGNVPPECPPVTCLVCGSGFNRHRRGCSHIKDLTSAPWEVIPLPNENWSVRQSNVPPGWSTPIPQTPANGNCLAASPEMLKVLREIDREVSWTGTITNSTWASIQDVIQTAEGWIRPRS